jgi:hypothetical protein
MAQKYMKSSGKAINGLQMDGEEIKYRPEFWRRTRPV